ncbi:hypothetical protein P4637_13685 [Halalkalibacterium halodurans]|nr:hypothetical protein [Halalkalibacterium halodurans]MED4085860.1 hypothetical protein [Halalkalibacterium halodurans]MED4105205.1 hypothetical protein [Halalkalibacterium halodurans]MED4111075.1 hypothetical protein [Halalkalibacterium halodurans]MED4149427.1 hypothetical protein [Halalkalibacterium halodurans]
MPEIKHIKKLAKVLPDGRIQYIDRSDKQIQLRGGAFPPHKRSQIIFKSVKSVPTPLHHFALR